MWLISEKTNGQFSAKHYTTDLKNNKIVRVILNEKTGTLQETVNFLLSFEQIGITDIEDALQAMDETGEDTAYFGVLGSFMFTGDEQTMMKGAA